VDINSAIGRKLGVTERQLAELHRFSQSDAFDEIEKLVLTLTDEMCKPSVNVSDELFGSLRKHFNEKQMVELVSAIAWENYRARFNRVFRIESNEFLEGEVCVIPQQG
jgi:alkylhydroperoxidase family enzyme